jgi:UDPglucose 6-dehydrogenase
MSLNISVIGSGYVGTTLSAILANAGYHTFALDIDQHKVDVINSGKSFFYEVGLDQLIANSINSGSLKATTDYESAIANSQVIFLSVGTPDNPDGSPDLSYVFGAVQTAIPFLQDGVIFAQRSTVPVGTGKQIIALIKTQRPELKFSYVSNPEFLAESSAVLDSLKPSRVVIGSDDESAIKTMQSIYTAINHFATTLNMADYTEFAAIYNTESHDIPLKFIVTKMESAEMIKVSANAFLALKISYANSIAKLSDAFGADITEVMDGIGADKRIGRSFLYAGLGYGGGCFPKDVSGLKATFESQGLTAPILAGQTEVNDSMADYVISKIDKLMNIDTIAVLGLAFKPGTSDCRKSPAIKLVNKLLHKFPTVKVFDPMAMVEAKQTVSSRAVFTNSTAECIQDADLVILATEWPEFANFDWSTAQLKQKNIIDARNRLDKHRLQALGYNYQGIGR